MVAELLAHQHRGTLDRDAAARVAVPDEVGPVVGQHAGLRAAEQERGQAPARRAWNVC